MTTLKYSKPETVFLKSHAELNEKWLQDRIADDPGILGLGELVVKDRERMQPRAGRLDLLLQDPETSRRYEVEIQLGATDEAHIIRTLEYWDIEKKRYPQYDHTAVIVAENITARFLNVISLFNGVIPLVAIQLKAVKLGENISLVFSTVLDQVQLGLVEDDEEVQAVTNRSWWEERATKQTLALTDEALELVREVAPGAELKYNKFYIGLARGGQPDNFVIFRPKKENLRLEVRAARSDEWTRRLEESGLDLLDYDVRSRRYRIRLTKKADLGTHRGLLLDILKGAAA